MKRLIPPSAIPLLLLALVAGGCAHEAKFPNTRFNMPETRGKAKPELEPGVPDTMGVTPEERPPIGRIAPMTIQTAHSVALFPRFTSGGQAPVAQRDLDYQAPTGGWAFQGDLALDDSWDLGVRIFPGAPLTFRAKRLLSGEPTSRATLRKLVISANAGAGFGLSDAGIGTIDSTDGQSRDGALSFTSFSVDAGLSAGMRLWRHTMIWIEPHAKFDTVSASLEFASAPGLNQSASGSGLLWGVSFGSRFEWERLFLMVELTWARGKFDGQDGVGFFPGVALGADI